ncbi:GNAT family N-acetyltransferase [Motiliproteus coralliicola]|uniref:GNAT family N-acetyltransferase n=1 Tax=Motiliproteus coralliicola TaxID=2283196 RepID=A0A369WET9_9GAMM|nr:GNAT family N-acetyltransferase [Motiliproteus coralliicola]RDE19679.1 GNAT family N-acetyltransferase [Motiliproteus coralliicola]
MKIRNFQSVDSDEIADLFHRSVYAIDDAIYTPAQKQAWAPPTDYAKWQARLQTSQPFVAVSNGQIVGFIELREHGYIDCLYVHPDHQHRGIATALLTHLCRAAYQLGLNTLSVEASKVALPFFERHGFEIVEAQVVLRYGQRLQNFRMQLSQQGLRKLVG